MLYPVIRKNESVITTASFETLKPGDLVWAGKRLCVVGVKAHYSGDASYDGYLLYSDSGEGIFPEDLDTQPTLYMRSKDGTRIGEIVNSVPASTRCPNGQVQVCWDNHTTSHAAGTFKKVSRAVYQIIE